MTNWPDYPGRNWYQRLKTEKAPSELGMDDYPPYPKSYRFYHLKPTNQPWFWPTYSRSRGHCTWIPNERKCTHWYQVEWTKENWKWKAIPSCVQTHWEGTPWRRCGVQTRPKRWKWSIMWQTEMWRSVSNNCFWVMKMTWWLWNLPPTQHFNQYSWILKQNLFVVMSSLDYSHITLLPANYIGYQIIIVFCMWPFQCHFFTLKHTSSLKCCTSLIFLWIS